MQMECASKILRAIFFLVNQKHTAKSSLISKQMTLMIFYSLVNKDHTAQPL